MTSYTVWTVNPDGERTVIALNAGERQVIWLASHQPEGTVGWAANRPGRPRRRVVSVEQLTLPLWSFTPMQP